MNRRHFLYVLATLTFGQFAFVRSAVTDEPVIVENLHLTAADTSRVNINDYPDVLIRNCTSEKISAKYVFHCRRNGRLRFEDISINDGSGWNSPEGGVVYRAGIILGTSQVPADGNARTELLRVRITNIGTPSSVYSQKNQDGLTVEVGNGRVFMRDCFIAGVSDGCVDSKAEVTARGCTFNSAYRNFRMWGANTKYYIQDCAFANTFPGGQHLWFNNSSIQVFILNCTFNGVLASAENPIPASMIGVDNGPLQPGQVNYITTPQDSLLDPFIADPGEPVSTINFTGVMSQTFDVSGAVTIQPDASLAGVQKVSYLYVDGTKTGSGAYSAPYAQTLDTTALADGDHTISGTYRSGGVDNPFSFTIRVTNTTPPPPPPPTSTILFTGASGQSYEVSGQVTVGPDLNVLPNVRKVSPFYVNGTKTGSGAYSSPFTQTLNLSPGTYTISMSYTDPTGDHSFWFNLVVR